ncbi:aldolase [Lentinus tigrinus ALCF2SS1-6]|uniref:hydroxymethylglutaryl-CoA lyase n=1 Tax=Lentinus tigrinus ALCF2SS1-6 TaxID=1328759 RepID=A0A5C2RWA0_9APHY|nr:aldolase [Lentinus tigrinus ALCF2SS1-6]
MESKREIRHALLVSAPSSCPMTTPLFPMTPSSTSTPTTSTPTTASAQSILVTSSIKPIAMGPHDGLQNESAVIPPAVQAELVNRLTNTGLEIIESGSFVSPKWVPQIPYTDEIAVFTAATDAFSKANTNCTVAESLERLEVITKRATKEALRMRGYVSVVIDCPYSGKVDPVKVKHVSHALLDMGWYEVSLSDTIGTDDPTTIAKLLRTSFLIAAGFNRLAGHYHDTYGMSVGNILASLEYGLHTFDSSVGGLGGCPYSPGATGNVATEDVLRQQVQDTGRPERDRGSGAWMSKMLNRTNSSHVGKALEARRAREQLEKERERDGGPAESISAKL